MRNTKIVTITHSKIGQKTAVSITKKSKDDNKTFFLKQEFVVAMRYVGRQYKPKDSDEVFASCRIQSNVKQDLEPSS